MGHSHLLYYGLLPPLISCSYPYHVVYMVCIASLIANCFCLHLASSLSNGILIGNGLIHYIGNISCQMLGISDPLCRLLPQRIQHSISLILLTKTGVAVFFENVFACSSTASLTAAHCRIFSNVGSFFLSILHRKSLEIHFSINWSRMFSFSCSL